MSCQDFFKRLINKAGNGEPTIPASADHQNNDWLETDVYTQEFYEDLDTNILHYRSDAGIVDIYDPSIGTDQRFGLGDTDVDTARVVQIDNLTGTFTFSVGGAPPVPTVVGDGPVSWAASGVAFKGISSSNTGVRGGSGTGTGGYFASNSGTGLEGESVSGVGLKTRGGAYIETYGVAGAKDASAVLEANSITQGFLPPRMTAVEAEDIASPAEGLMVYATDGTGVTITTKGWWGYDGATWKKLD